MRCISQSVRCMHLKTRRRCFGMRKVCDTHWSTKTNVSTWEVHRLWWASCRIVGVPMSYNTICSTIVQNKIQRTRKASSLLLDPKPQLQPPNTALFISNFSTGIKMVLLALLFSFLLCKCVRFWISFHFSSPAFQARHPDFQVDSREIMNTYFRHEKPMSCEINQRFTRILSFLKMNNERLYLDALRCVVCSIRMQ